MITQQLRPKYKSEQYIVLFNFPGLVTGRPIVTVELVSGDDPNFATLAGWAFNELNSVGVAIANGVPGCLYKIICQAIIGTDTFTVTGNISVIPDSADQPPGFSITPQATSTSSPLYPSIYRSAGSLSVSVLNGTLRITVKNGEYSDAVDLLTTIQSGKLEILAPPKLPPDEVDVLVTILSGALLPPPMGTYPDEILLTTTITSGFLSDTPRGRIPDEVDVVVTITSGRLYL